jgi:hypothetical protein
MSVKERNMRFILPCVLIAACVFATSDARAQLVPFFNANPTGFDPEISVVNSGELLDAQAVVSNDMKYVTINARASSSRLLALREFTFQSAGGAPLGFVGGAGQQLNRRRPNNALDRRGMTFIRGLSD